MSAPEATTTTTAAAPSATTAADPSSSGEALSDKAAARKARKEAAKAAKAAKRADKSGKQQAAGAKGGAGAADSAKKAAPKAAPGQGRKGKARAKAAAAKNNVTFVNTTPVGEKKDLSGEMAKEYSPMAVEAAWYDWWVKEGFFRADAGPVLEKKKEPFVMTIPPPNVTGALHMGHALTNSVEDAIMRHRRMAGYEVLWIPGTDHAGIATQTVVEKKLWKEEQKTRHDLGREAFVARAHEWKHEYGGRIISQLKRLGSSLDWDREFFTMDENLSVAVQTAFVKLWDDGLIFRAKRLVNWSCALCTAISDIEVDHIELAGRTMMTVPGHGETQYEFGVLTSFAYKVEGSDEELVVATTRPETMLGDTAVAIHPDDDRYKHLHGKRLVHPFHERTIPVVLDGELVDMTFGTGAVKVTPAHDPNDFLCGNRHNLERINLLNEDGTLNENAGQFQGMKRFDARNAVVEALKEKDLYRGTKDNPMSIGVCSRSKDIIEPYLKPQWWVKCDGMAKRAADVVREGKMEILPAEHKETWYRWLDNSRDWCISRQLWWGHRCPAFKISSDGGKTFLSDEENESWVAAANADKALEKARAKHPEIPADQIAVEQDPDVLDTWFSSGLLPFSALKWPDVDDADMKAFFPTALLETGHDILFFWVARMVMMSLQLTDTIPFAKVYLHAMVRDAHGKKMSKSTGNVIDPVDMITGCTLQDLHDQLRVGNLDARQIAKAEAGQKIDFPNGIPECGTDATRFALVSYTTQGRDINLDVLRVSAYRNFCNKLWNAIKFALYQFSQVADFLPLTAAEADSHAGVTLEEKWILSRLDAAVQDAAKGWEGYLFADMTSAIFSFWRYDFCDNFLEVSKPILQKGSDEEKSSAIQTLYTCVETGLRLIHPLMPFLSEELWQRLPRRPTDTAASVMVASYPTPVSDRRNLDAESVFGSAQDIVAAMRSMRTRFGLTKDRPPVVVNVRDEALMQSVGSMKRMISFLGRSDDVQFAKLDAPPAGSTCDVVNETIEVYTQVKGVVDVAQEVAKLRAGLGKIRADIAQMERRMSMPHYEEKVPQKVRDENAEKAAALQQQLENAEAGIKALEEFQ